MKIKLFCILTIPVLLLAGCVSSQLPDEAQEKRLVQLQVHQELGPYSIRILNMTSVLRPGDTGSLTIAGKPGVRYSITATYKLRTSGANNTVRAFAGKTAGNDGMVTWTWKVGADTEAGTYPIAISGDGKRIKTTYTVVR